MLNVLLSACFFLYLVSVIAKQKSNSSEEPNSDDDSVSTESFCTNDVPKSTNDNANLQAHCALFSVIMQFKMTLRMMKKKTNYFLICKFFHSQCLHISSALTFTFRENVSAWNTRGVFVGTLLEITSPLMPFENFDFTFTQ